MASQDNSKILNYHIKD